MGNCELQQRNTLHPSWCLSTLWSVHCSTESTATACSIFIDGVGGVVDGGDDDDDIGDDDIGDCGDDYDEGIDNDDGGNDDDEDSDDGLLSFILLH